MNDPYEEEDDGYDDSHDYDNNNSNPYKWYFQFDIGHNTPFSDWITDIINNINDFPSIQFPVNSWNPNTVNDKKFQYLGSNYYGEGIWKSKYFVFDPIYNEYKQHIQSHATYFIQQPKYYKGLFDILN